MAIAWDAHYPDPERLRHEVERVAELYVEALLEGIPKVAVRGIYLTGSANKQWDSPLDYVPQVSDVDLHVWFHDEHAWSRYLGSVSVAMEVQRQVELRYRADVNDPLHEPRPQLVVMNKMMAELSDLVFSPRSTVRVLYGEEYPESDYSDPDRIRRVDCGRLIEDETYVDALPLHVVDTPGRYIWEAMRPLVWRVSPTGPRVLHVSGVDTETAWSKNRTRVISMLREVGRCSLADSYEGYYLSAWDYFLSSYHDTDAARSAIEHAVQVLTEGADVARAWLAGNPTREELEDRRRNESADVV